MRHGTKALASVLLGLIAATMLLASIGILTMLPPQAAKDRVYYQNFKDAAERMDAQTPDTGALPDPDTLQRLLADDRASEFLLSVHSDDPCADFPKAKGDRFVLSWWRGDWFECFAYPSGRTTLGLSVRGYLLKGLGLQLALLVSIAVGSIWLIRRLWSGKRRPAARPA